MPQQFKAQLTFAKGMGPGAIVEVCGGNFVKSDKKKVSDYLMSQGGHVAHFSNARVKAKVVGTASATRRARAPQATLTHTQPHR